MELKNKLAKVIVIGGLARTGKDTSANYMKEYFESNGLKTIKLGFSSYIKMYAKEISSWDGSDETKPRSLLQELGTDIIRNRIDRFLFINRIIEDIKVYSYFFDVIIICDARLREEIDGVKEAYSDAVSVHVIRDNFDNDLTDEEKKHITETGLNDYNNYDYEIDNNGTLDDLRVKAIDIAKDIEREM